MNQKLFIIIAIVVVGAGAFFGGMQFQKSQQTAGAYGMMGTNGNPTMMGNGQGNGNRGPGRGGFGGRGVIGQVVSQDDTSLTIKEQNGKTAVVFLSSTTRFNKTSEASKTDIKVGDTVLATGTVSSDGSVNAQSVQLNPMFRGPSGMPTPQPSK